jgi:hypothetical protein
LGGIVGRGDQRLSIKEHKEAQNLISVKVCVMPKRSLAADHLPASAAKALRDLGENLALARQRRKESLRAWASRMAVSVPTLIRMEKGDPSVGMGVYATALWLMGRHAALPEVAAPAQDLNALEQDIEAVRQRSKRLSRKPEPSL